MFIPDYKKQGVLRRNFKVRQTDEETTDSGLSISCSVPAFAETGIDRLLRSFHNKLETQVCRWRCTHTAIHGEGLAEVGSLTGFQINPIRWTRTIRRSTTYMSVLQHTVFLEEAAEEAFDNLVLTVDVFMYTRVARLKQLLK